MLADLDHGIRCEEHIGEAFRPRCYDCDALVSQWGELDYRLCPLHPVHFRPCEKCELQEVEE